MDLGQTPNSRAAEFGVCPQNSSTVKLTDAKFRSIDRGANSGDVVVQPDKQTGAVAYDVRYALSNGGVLGQWTIVTVVKANKVTISGLTLAGIYQFQIRALGVLGYTDWMDTKTFVVA
ncbi:MAG TPA: fibronectin type III domain-containing protein [Terriglobia bacterium]|nr:fibronectin type III domain-containing protein [Terriglobia bacterium]